MLRWYLLLILICRPAFSLDLVLPASSDQSHAYYHELLLLSLADIGEEVVLRVPYQHLPQKRAVKLLNNNLLTLYWLIESKQRNKKYTRVSVGLTLGLIGKRILLVPPADKDRYKEVKNLADFRRLNTIGGFGANWFDIQVWEKNKLKYMIRDGEWRALYSMLSSKGGVNYFSRGFNEIVAEQKIYPHLAIEPHLVLEYDRDFVFYLNKNDAHLVPVLEKALLNAKKTGLMQRLIQKYWKENFDQLKLKQRTRLQLVTP